MTRIALYFALEAGTALPNSICDMKKLRRIKDFLLAALLAFAPLTAQAGPVQVFAAASLQGPLDAVTTSWDAGSTISYAGSGTIARQISLGAPADVAILANGAWADWLYDNGHAPDPARALLSNRLVVITAAGGPVFDAMDSATLTAALGDARLAMGQHQSVPAGIYAKAWLEQISAWDTLRSQLAETDNVRAALALVARREVPLGIVYRSDAQASAEVTTAWTVPADAHPPILYYGLAFTPEGEAFLAHLATQTAPFLDAGFEALP